MEKLLVTPAEAAEVLAISRSKLYQLMNNGALPSVRIGTCRRIRCEALKTFLDGLRDSDEPSADC